MPAYAIVIPDWLPTTKNVWQRANRHARRKLMKAATEMVWYHARLAGVPPAACRRRVTLAFRAPGGRGAKNGDPDARLSCCLDAMVRAGLLVDDSDRWCVLMPREGERGPTRTLIHLEDLE